MGQTDDRRRRAREVIARDLNKTYEKQNKPTSYEKCYREVCERGDRIDAKKDRNIKED